MRKVMAPEGLKVGAHTIPKGDVVGLCAPASNLDPRYWSDVTQFKPERYLAGADAADMFDSRSVGHGLMQGFMLSFGGGAHMCSSRRFGYLQVPRAHARTHPPAPTRTHACMHARTHAWTDRASLSNFKRNRQQI